MQVPADFQARGSAAELTGRRAECGVLDRLVEAVRAGESRALVDRASAQVRAFVARRLGAESVGLVFAARVPGGELAGLPELALRGLRGTRS